MNTPEVLFFTPVLRHLQTHHRVDVTLRNRAETPWLASYQGMNFRVAGGDAEGWMAKRAGLAWRTFLLSGMVPAFDAALSFGNPNAVLVTQWRSRPNVVFEDNDLDWAAGRSLTDEIVRRIVWTSTFKIVPEAFPTHRLLAAGIPEDSVYTFPGFKEQIYLADFHPNPSFPEHLPADPYVVVRPEAGSSSYVAREPSLVPRLLRALEERGINVVFLPRAPSDRLLLNGSNAYVPDEPVFGPDLVWNAACVMTGSGTMAREAACLGVPAISFFPGRNGDLLSVDRQLVGEGKMTHARDLDVLVSSVTEALEGDPKPDVGSNTQVLREFLSIVDEVVHRIGVHDLPE